MTIPLVDLAAIHDPLHTELMAAIEGVVRSNRFIMGPEVEAFEREIGAWLGVDHAIGVSSGTDALLMALMALGVGPGDEVLTTPYSFFATAGVIHRLGARPVFADIEPESFNLDPRQVAAALTPRTRAIIVVHLFGRSADLDALGAIAKDAGVPLIEDAAQSIGAEWGGRRVGGIGAVGCFSFFPAKNLGAFGDGGLVTTGDEALAARLGAIRTHGGTRRYLHDEVGGNFRLDALQAAILRVKLPWLEEWTAARQDNAARYAALFAASGLGERVGLPAPGPGRPVWNQYVVRIRDGRRNDVFDALVDAGIGRAVYYPRPLHLQPCFAYLGLPLGALPEAERASREALALPVAPGTSASDQERVVQVISGALGVA